METTHSFAATINSGPPPTLNIQVEEDQTSIAPSEHTLLLSPEEISTALEDQDYIDDAELLRIWKYMNEQRGPAPGARPANRDTRFTNILAPGKSFGIPLMSTLSLALYGDWDTRNNGHFYRVSSIETWYYLRYMTTSNPPSPEAVVEHIRCLVDYLERTPGRLRVADFILFVRGNSGWVRDKEFDNAWNLFFLVLGFPQWIPMHDTFEESIRSLYPRSSSPSQPFSTTLDDILAADLAIVPTSFMQEHLTVEENTIKVYKPTLGDLFEMHHYASNRAAKVLQIQSLGAEIATSLYILYGKTPQLLDRARDLHILPEGEACIQLLSILFQLHTNETPKVLAHRNVKLRCVIAYRSSWWPSLRRDIRRSRHQQPWLFWGTFFAIGFGSTAIIQTLASVVSCYYAILAFNATLQPIP